MNNGIAVKMMPIRLFLQAISVGIAVWILVNYEKSKEEER